MAIRAIGDRIMACLVCSDMAIKKQGCLSVWLSGSCLCTFSFSCARTRTQTHTHTHTVHMSVCMCDRLMVRGASLFRLCVRACACVYVRATLRVLILIFRGAPLSIPTCKHSARSDGR